MSSLALALGQVGVLVSLCVFGVRYLFVLPVSLSLALCGRSSAEPGSGKTRDQSAPLYICLSCDPGVGRYGRVDISAQTGSFCAAAYFVKGR